MKIEISKLIVNILLTGIKTMYDTFNQGSAAALQPRLSLYLNPFVCFLLIFIKGLSYFGQVKTSR